MLSQARAKGTSANERAARSQRQITELTGELARVQAELEAERKTQDSLLGALRDTEETALTIEARIAALVSARAGLQHKVVELETQMGESEQYVSTLIEQIDRKTKQIDDGAAYAIHLQDEIDARDREMEILRLELDAIRKAALADKVVMQEYLEHLRAQVAEIPELSELREQALTQTEDLIASMQTENAQLVRLIDTVQSSRFWKLKRFLVRARARAAPN